MLGRALACLAGGVCLVGLSTARQASPGEVPLSPAATAAVAVARHDLPAHATLRTADLLSVYLAGLPDTGVLLRDVSAAQGRRLVVAMRAGTPIPLSALEPVAGAAPDRRLLTVRIERARLSADVMPGAIVDVVASLAPAGSGAGDAGRVLAVARASVVTVAPNGSAAAGDRSPPAAGTGDSSSDDLAVTLDCAAADALRIAWAADFARALRLIAEAGGSPLPLTADGPEARP